MKKLLILLMLVLVGCTCIEKDPQVVLPGWADNTLEFGEYHQVIIYRTVDGDNFSFYNTTPGWYATPSGSNIDDVMWCD